MIVRRIATSGDTFEVSSRNNYKRIDGLDYILVGLIQEKNIIHKYSGVFTFDIYPEEFMDLFMHKMSFNFYIKKINQYNMNSEKNKSLNESEYVKLNIKIIGKRENLQDEFNSNDMYIFSEEVMFLNLCHGYELIELDILKMLKKWKMYGETKLTIEFSIDTLNIAILIENNKYKNRAFIKICCDENKKYTFIRGPKGEIDSKEPIGITKLTEEQCLMCSDVFEEEQRPIEETDVRSSDELSRNSYRPCGIQLQSTELKGKLLEKGKSINFDSIIFNNSSSINYNRETNEIVILNKGLYTGSWWVSLSGGENILDYKFSVVNRDKTIEISAIAPIVSTSQINGQFIFNVTKVPEFISLVNSSDAVVQCSQTSEIQADILMIQFINND